jgi:hypothetical protein
MGISNNAYDKPKAPKISPICSFGICRSPAVGPAAKEKLRAIANPGATRPTKNDSTVTMDFLTPSIDHLFDRGFIGFEDNGRLIISPVAHSPSLQRMCIDTAHAINVGVFLSRTKAVSRFSQKRCSAPVDSQLATMKSPRRGEIFGENFRRFHARHFLGVKPFGSRARDLNAIMDFIELRKSIQKRCHWVYLAGTLPASRDQSTALRRN